MKITTIGRGNIGGGLARRWERAGHEVQTLGSEGGDASDADVVLVAVPGAAIAEALGKVTERARSTRRTSSASGASSSSRWRIK